MNTIQNELELNSVGQRILQLRLKQNLRVVALGDSSVYGIGDIGGKESQVGFGWTGRLAHDLQATKYLNLSKNGARAADVLVEQLPSALAVRADIAVICVGGNDALRNNFDPVGGVISGFFGGLSGHQGLFRSAFLLKSGLNKTSFIATGVGIAVLVDITRLSVYGSTLFTTSIISTQNFWLPVTISTASALFGVSLATDLVKKMTIDLIRNMVYVFIFLTGVLLILGKI